jgi:type IV secretory pathway protease TraF
VIAARAPGPWANNLQLVVAVRDAAKQIVDLKIVRDQQDLEVFRNVAVGQIAAKLNSDSRLVVVPDQAPGDAVDGDRLQGGKDASADAYKAAIDRLRNEADVDLVLAAIQDFGNADTVVDIYSAVISHCNNMADSAKGRIGFGQVPPATSSQNAVTMASKLISDRFVLLAPSGVAGATAGLVGNLTYFYSPTFKVVTGLKAQKMDVEDQKALLKGHVVPVAFEQGKGTIVLRGLTTDGDQISVRRVADRAVRGVKMLGELFIGRLNNADGRSALKQKIVEFFLQMQKDGAIVPSTDGSDPAFKVNVYSSQDDFALGIVRVDVAVRPVRAIDYIYATIQVQI